MNKIYLEILHHPVPGEPWINDLWLVPVEIPGTTFDGSFGDLTALLGSRAWANGYDPFFLDILNSFRPRRGLSIHRHVDDAVRSLQATGQWLDGPLRVVEVSVNPLWVLSENNEAWEQGIDPADLPHTFDPRDLLNFPGSDFQGIHLERDDITPRCQLVLRETLVDLEHLRAYRRHLTLGSETRAFVWRAVIADSLSVLDAISAKEEWERLLLEFPEAQLRRPPRRFGEAVEVPVSARDAENIVLDTSHAGGSPLWPRIDPTPPRRVTIPDGVTYPLGWFGDEDEDEDAS